MRDGAPTRATVGRPRHTGLLLALFIAACGSSAPPETDPPPDAVPPTADAGADQVAVRGDAVTLDGSDSSAGDAELVDWLWEQTDGPPVADLEQDRTDPLATFTAPEVEQESILVFRLTVTDGHGASDSDTTVVVVRLEAEDDDDGLVCAPDALPLIGGFCLPLDPGDPDSDGLLDQLALELGATLRGCDPLDASNCMYPFPSNHYTRAVAPHQIGGTDREGTGRRIAFNPLGMPRNVAGKPIDPTEWNRNDGFSPGQMLMTFVPGLGVLRDDDGAPTGPVRNAVPINDLARFADPDTAVVVIDTETGERHPIWVETDLNAGFLFPPGGTERAGEAERALLVQPAANFREGRRYVVVVRNLENEDGNPIGAQPYFATCRDEGPDAFISPALHARCAQLHDEVFDVVAQHGIATQGNEALYLAWDFTVASTWNNVARLRHMRDEAFSSLAEGDGVDCTRYEDGIACAAPDFEVTEVIEGNTRNKDFREIRGNFEVPSFVVPVDPSPLETLPVANVLQALDDNVLAELDGLCQDNAPDDAFCVAIEELRAGVTGFDSELQLLTSVSLPPNRLFYNPADEFHPDDPAMALYGDGLPNRTGSRSVPWICRLYEDARPEAPARAGIYGHGLFDQRRAITYDAVPDLSVFDPDANYMFCAVDWFGFAQGDIVNVLLGLPDLSLFGVIPDATQQGMLQMMFLARLLRDPDGFASHEAFRDPDSGAARFDHREIYYHGISQGGILGGPVVAMSKDIERGVLGVPGMAYTLLLRRSTGWSRPAFADEVPFSFSTLPYVAYQGDLDRNLMFGLIQMLWDRGEGNGYMHHVANNAALEGPDNTVMLRPAFADHLVTHWSAHNMARTILASGDDIPFLADMYPRPCDTGVPHCFSNRDEFSAQRDPDVQLLFGMPLSDRDVAYDAPGGARTMRSGLIQWDEGLTAVPPIGNIPADWQDDDDPHGFPRNAPGSLCQQSHFLHPQGRLIDVRDVITGAPCPPLPTVD